MKNVSNLPASLSLTSMLSTSNSSTRSSFLPLEMLGGLAFCCWIIHSSYFKNHRKEYISVQWEMRFWTSLTVHHGRIERNWRKTHTPGIYGGCSLETWIWRLWNGVLMILNTYSNRLSIYMWHHWDHSVQLWSWTLVVWGSRKFICGIVCAQESWFLLIGKVFAAVVESCLYWTRVVMSMSQDMCLLMWTEVFSTNCSWYLFIWSIGCHKYGEKNSEACALPDSASSFSNYVVFEAEILVFLEELEEEAWA